MKELMDHIKARNVKTRAWVAAAPGRWATTFIEDEEWWRKQGITTLEQFTRDELASTLNDIYKDAYGRRPRHLDWDNITNDEMQVMIDRCQAAINFEREAEERDAQMEAEAKARFTDATPLTFNPFEGLTL